MKKYTIGFFFGLLIGIATSAMAARIVGGNGWLNGWDVTVDGETVCTDPYVWSSIREIECD